MATRATVAAIPADKSRSERLRILRLLRGELAPEGRWVTRSKVANPINGAFGGGR